VAQKNLSKMIAVTTSGAYAAGDVIGGIVAIPFTPRSGRRVTLRSVQINDKNGNSSPLNLYFFKDTPAAGTYTDNSALAWGAGDSANKVGQVKVAAGDYLVDASQSSVNLSSLNVKMPVLASTLYLLIVAPTGSTPTYTNGNLVLDLEFDPE
jgi:hypothetical protein